MTIKIKLKYYLRFGLASLLVMLLGSGCSSKLSPNVRQQQADHFALVGGLVKQKIQTDNFLLTTYQRFNHTNNNKKLVVYIEGDGMAWVGRDQLSTNPTPVRPIALELASLDKSTNVLYIARPCQYLWPKSTVNCSSKYWSSKRGSAEVIVAINQVISKIKEREDVSSIKLIGYSGGGGIAAIITAGRDDVNKLITVSGNLNYQLFTKIHKLTPMMGSIDPITIAKQIISTPQIHYVGGMDKIVPEKIARSFSKDVRVIQGTTHDNWSEKWSMILANSY